MDGFTAASDLLGPAMGLRAGEQVFPWQKELLRMFMRGKIPRALDIPTGLGKTSVMAIWLIARAAGAKVPRRLVYIVDRRAIVDQATETAMRLQEFVSTRPDIAIALGLGENELPISTLRGRYVDNRRWIEDPASPAIIVGTVDMTGSRLLFSGYGISRRMRPVHAALLGIDTLLVLDESHLVPPFEKLLDRIATGFGVRNSQRIIANIPRPVVLSLSATGNYPGKVFTLGDADLAEGSPIIQRLNSVKRLRIIEGDPVRKLAENLAEQAWKLSGDGVKSKRILVYCTSRKGAEQVKAIIEKLSKKRKQSDRSHVTADTELFVGGRRIFERAAAAERLREMGFFGMHGEVPSRPSFVISTSAGEVGVDMNADGMVCDLAPWERMVQRMGRVNRFGRGESDIIVVAQEYGKKSSRNPIEIIDQKAVLKQLPEKDGIYDASPMAFFRLSRRAEYDMELRRIIEKATTKPPLRPRITRELIEAWSMTSLKRHSGRPDIRPWLRGWVDDPPQTAVVWRRFLPVQTDGTPFSVSQIEAFFDVAPVHTAEILEDRTDIVIKWLAKRIDKSIKNYSESDTWLSSSDSLLGFIFSANAELVHIMRIQDFFEKGSGKRARLTEALRSKLAGGTVVLDARIAGLSHDGLLNDRIDDIPRTADDGGQWPDSSGGEDVGFLIRIQAEPDEPNSNKASGVIFQRFPLEFTAEGEVRQWLIIEQRKNSEICREDAPVGFDQLLTNHHSATTTAARALAVRLGLPSDYIKMLMLAARWHDQGKCATKWQRAFNAPEDSVYAKTKGPVNTWCLDGYRHELGSLIAMDNQEEIRKISKNLQELARHIVTAHHGFARPVISVRGCEDAPPSSQKRRACDIALRFARLQAQWGPWVLAWWETLLRSVDWKASRKPSKSFLNQQEKKEAK